MKVHLMERVPGTRGALTVLEIEFTSKARSVRVTTSEGLEALDLRGERTGGTYDAAPTLTRLHVPLRVTADGGRSVTVSVTVKDAAGQIAPEAWEGTVRLEAARRKGPSAALLLGGFGAVAAGIAAFVILPMLRPPTVPSLVGKPQAEAERTLKSMGFAPVVEQVDSTADAGRVIAQVPAPDTQPPKNSPVLLRVGRRPTTVEVPQLVGRLRTEAEAALSGTGLQVSVAAEDAPEASDGRVLRQRPAAGNAVAPGTTLELIVGRRSGVALRDVPDVAGLVAADAIAALERAGLLAKVAPMAVEVGSDRVGKVVEQTPAGGGRLPEGSTVSLWVGAEPRPPAVAQIPYVVGVPRAEAEAAVAAAGFEVVVDDVEPSVGPAGVVASQDPVAGAARAGTRVTLRVPRPAGTPVAVVPSAMGEAPPAMTEAPPAMAETPMPAAAPTAPDLRRLTRAQAEAEAQRAGVRVVWTQEDVSSDTPDGIVLRQVPAPGAPLGDGGVALVVSRAVATPPPAVPPTVPPPTVPPPTVPPPTVPPPTVPPPTVPPPTVPPPTVPPPTVPPPTVPPPTVPPPTVPPPTVPPPTVPPPTVPMPDLVGLSRAAAEDLLARAGVRVRVGEEDTGGETPEGLVLHQRPSAGDPVGAEGAEIVVARRGPAVVAPTYVPDVVGRAADDAMRVLRAGGYVPRLQEEATSPERIGLVLRQAPGAREAAPPGSSVVVYVGKLGGSVPVAPPPLPPVVPAPSTGPRPVPPPIPTATPGTLPPPRRLTRPGEALPPPVSPTTAPPPRVTPSPLPPPAGSPASGSPASGSPAAGTPGSTQGSAVPPPPARPGAALAPGAGTELVATPDLVGRDAAEAIEVALRAGVLPTVVGDRDARAAAGRVRMQSLAAGAAVRTGTSIAIQVGAGASPAMVDVPSVTGLSVDAAVARLTAAGLSTSIAQVAARPGVFAPGVIVAQTPAGRFAADLARVVRLYTVDR